jgi:tRNA (mo5U34)-methyltransferase
MKDLDDLGEDGLRRRIEELGPWFHNLRLGGHETAPDHFLGDFPRTKFERFSHAVPKDLRGRSVLDIGCNAGFYSLEMKRRGAARVLGVDHDPHYLDQARFAAEVSGLDIEFRQLEVYDVGSLGETFDVVIFMGVLYHLRHPLLALDLIREHVARDTLIFQSLQRGAEAVLEIPTQVSFSEEAIFHHEGYPALYFIENWYAEDWTNWWIPNRAATEAMLRAAGFRIETRASEDVYICRATEVPYAHWGAGAAYPARGAVR